MSSNDIQTRAATEADAQDVIALYIEFSKYMQSLGDDASSRLTVERYLEDGFGPDPAFSGLVAECDGSIVGYVLYHFGYDAAMAARTMYLIDVFVSRNFRSKGIGKRLMDHAESVCRSRGVIELQWSIFKANRNAYDFYRRLGGRRIHDLNYMYLEIDDHD